MASRLFAVDLDLGLNKAKQFVFEDFSSDPTSATGRVYFNTSGTPRLKVYTGSAWKSLAYTDDVGATYSISAETAASGANLRLTGSDSTTDDVNFVGSGSASVSRTDANTITISASDTTYSAATSSVLGLVKLFSDTDQTEAANSVTTTSGRTYGIQLNASDQAVVNVPWSDTTYSAATSSTLGLVKLFSDTAQTTAAEAVSSTASRTYGIQVDGNGKLVVNVPWSDTDTDTNYYPTEIVFTAGTTAGPTLDLTMSGGAPDITAVAIPSASSTASGVVTTGTQSFAGAKTFTGNVIVDGDLTVSGNTVTLDVATLLVEDNIIVLNKNVTGTPSTNAGIEIERGDSTNASITWNETSEFWTAGLAGSEKVIARKHSASVNTTGGSKYAVQHGLGTTAVTVQCWYNGALIETAVDLGDASAADTSNYVSITTNNSLTGVTVVVIG